jgi:protein transport protein SEC24
MPPRLNLSSERLERHGCYLVENGQRILIWIGREAVPQLCTDLLNVAQVSEIRSGQVNYSWISIDVSNINVWI